jgi:hypothetical protein
MLLRRELRRWAARKRSIKPCIKRVQGCKRLPGRYRVLVSRGLSASHPGLAVYVNRVIGGVESSLINLRLRAFAFKCR